MALFEGYERRINQINAALKQNGIGSLEEAESICKGKGLRSVTGTMYSTKAKGPRYLEMAEGYVTKLALDANDEIIGYQFVRLGPMMEQIAKGVAADAALAKCTGTYGRFAEAVKTINPRHE